MAPNSDPALTCNRRSQPIRLSFDILDYILAFLKHDSDTLAACSKAHPEFSPIVERHIYYHIVIPTLSDAQRTGRGYCLEAPHLIQLLSKTPQIANRVRILQIVFCGWPQNPEPPSYEGITQILPIFPALECLILTSEYSFSWNVILSEALAEAMKDCLRSPTLEEVHIGALRLPLGLLNSNIKSLSLSGPPEIPDGQDHTTYPQLESLTVANIDDHICEPISRIWDWAKRHVTKLHSLKCDYSSVTETVILEVLEICSGTLNNLDLRLEPHYDSETTYYVNEGNTTSYPDHHRIPLINLSSFPHLQHLTIRMDVDYEDLEAEDNPEDTDSETYCITSYLPSTVEILQTASSLEYLTIEICVDDDRTWNNIDFSPLSALAECKSTFFHHVDLYVMDITHTEIVSILAHYKGLKNLIKQGILVIHVDETAPGISRFV